MVSRTVAMAVTSLHIDLEGLVRLGLALQGVQNHVRGHRAVQIHHPARLR